MPTTPHTLNGDFPEQLIEDADSFGPDFHRRMTATLLKISPGLMGILVTACDRIVRRKLNNAGGDQAHAKPTMDELETGIDSMQGTEDIVIRPSLPETMEKLTEEMDERFHKELCIRHMSKETERLRDENRHKDDFVRRLQTRIQSLEDQICQLEAQIAETLAGENNRKHRH